jgi:hypothetical protein
MILVGLPDRQLTKLLFVVQGITTLFCGLFVSVYLLGLRDLPENVVYHSQPTVRVILSTLGVTSLILIGVTILLAFIKKRKN